MFLDDLLHQFEDVFGMNHHAETSLRDHLLPAGIFAPGHHGALHFIIHAVPLSFRKLSAAEKAALYDSAKDSGKYNVESRPDGTLMINRNVGTNNVMGQWGGNLNIPWNMDEETNPDEGNGVSV